jgi:hypothetical protein
LPDAVALADTTWTAVGSAGDELVRLDRTARKLGRAASARATVASLFEHGAAAAPALDWARGKPLTVGLVSGLQAALVHGTRGDWGDAGRLRRGDVFLCDQAGPIERSRFVPAPHGAPLAGAFEHWIRWLNRTDSYLSPVVQAGLAHYQFETLHPYSDGNGRVGRLAIVLALVRRGVLRYPSLAVSRWLDDHKAVYQDGLLELSRTGDWDPWLTFFATAIGGAADATQQRLQGLLDDYRQTSRPRRGTLVRGAARGRRTGRDPRPASLAAAAVLAAFAVAACGGSSSSKTAAGVKGSSEVAASPISTAGANPFTPSTGTDKSGLKSPAGTASTSGGPATYVASLPGLYGGTRNYKTCDAQKLVAFLQQNPAKATAWASTLGISTTDIPHYMSGLTPVLLRTDTRVTNHGYVNGVADPIQSVLEAGTAVFVNKYGEPVVKCYCGNPLTPPELLSAPVYTGPLWASFTTINITIIEQSPTIINTYTLYDPNTGTEFKRTSGLHGHDGPYINIGPSQNPTPGGATAPSTPSQQTSTGGSTSTPPQTNTQPAENPSVSLSPNPVVQGATVTLSASGFAPRASLQITVNRPDGVVEHYPLTAGGDGSATYTFSNAAGNAPLGTYNVTVTDLATGASGSASIDVVPPPSNSGTNPSGTSPGTTPSGTSTGTTT